MTKFRKFFEEKEFAALGDLGSGISEHLIKIARLAAENHLEALLEFYRKLAHKDPIIKAELEAYEKDPTIAKPIFPHHKEIDVISTGEADKSASEDES